MIKKLISVSLGLGMVLAATAPVFAGVNVGVTGPGSYLDARINRVKAFALSLSNNYALTQNTTSNQSTGGNKSSNNTGGGTALAGNVTGNYTSQVEANTSNLDVSVPTDLNTDDNVTVNTTGPSSTANAVVSNTNTVSLSVSNTGTVTNNFTSNVKTGHNTASNNTGSGMAVGGDSSVTSLISTKLNAVMLKLSM